MNSAHCSQLVLIHPCYKASFSFNQGLRFTLRQITTVRRHFRLSPIGCSPKHAGSQSDPLKSSFHRRSPSTHLKSAGILPHADPFPVLENVGCCRAVHFFLNYIHSNIMVNNPNFIPDRTQFTDLFTKTA